MAEENKKTVACNMTLYPDDLAELDTLARILGTTRSSANRFIINCWRNRDIGDPQIRELVNRLAETETVPS